MKKYYELRKNGNLIGIYLDTNYKAALHGLADEAGNNPNDDVYLVEVTERRLRP